MSLGRQYPMPLDAYCSHLGAHLGKGGKVAGNTLKCPFHGCQYGGEGKCIEVPFAKKIPSGARVGCWPVREVNGVIFVYRHAEGAPPDFEIPELEEYVSGEYAHGRIGRTIRAEIGEDIPVWENKTFYKRPALRVHDGFLIRFRRWNYQFYTLPDAKAQARQG